MDELSERPETEVSATPDAAGLEYIHLTARGIAHALNNHISVAVGNISLVLADPTLPPLVQERLRQAETALMVAGRQLGQVQRLSRAVTRDTPEGPMVDLAQSLA